MRAIDPTIEIRPGTDVEEAWRRFEVFEALHHTMQICNPMTSAQLDEVVDALEVSSACSILDVGCGYGELILRCAERADVGAIGIDESPWMVTTALENTRRRVPHNEHVRWVLGDARNYVPPSPPTIAVCVGAEWVWHDFKGTTRALADRVAPGGSVVVGAARLHRAADQVEIRQTRGHVDTIDDMRIMLEERGLQPLHRVDPDDDGWDRYLTRTADAARQWAEMNPGPRAEQWLEEQRDWQTARERDRDVIGWSLWIAHKA